MLIDLSVSLNEQTPVYPGDPKTKIVPSGILEKDGYHDHYLSIGTHVGTHIDAPSHMLQNGKTLDQFPIEHFSGRGVYIDCKNGFDMEIIKTTDIQGGDIVILHTGKSDIYGHEEYFENYPQIPDDVALYLTEKKVKIVGMDMCSPDHAPFSIHKIFLAKDILIIENLTNLAVLQKKQFVVYAFPLKLAIDASPVRVVADTK